jgi:small subunit ribosomal protein S17
MAHDERSECRLGDVVEIVSTRPMSARKRWRIARIVLRGTSGAPVEVEVGTP